MDDHSPICYNFNKNFLAVGSSTGDIYVWDINQRVNCVCIQNCIIILNSTLVDVYITAYNLFGLIFSDWNIKGLRKLAIG